MVTIQQGLEEDGFQVSMGQAVPLVWRGQAQSVLPANQDRLDSRPGLGSANQGADRSRAVVCLSLHGQACAG